MTFLGAALPALVLSLPMAASTSQVAPQPAKQFAALLDDYRPVSGGMRRAGTDLERKTAVEQLATFAPKFVELATEHADDPIALQALQQAAQAVNTTDSAAQIAWETNRSDFPTGSADDTADKIVTLLLRDHVRSDRLGPVCERIRWGYRIEYERFLRTVLRANRHRDVQAVACLSLARFLNDRCRMVALADDRPDLVTRYASVFGENYLPELRRWQRSGLAGRIEALLERATQYDDVKSGPGSTVAEQARRELYDLRHLAIGKAAPDIEGKDQDGAPFRLSDYRGKVVLLYFWSEL